MKTVAYMYNPGGFCSDDMHASEGWFSLAQKQARKLEAEEATEVGENRLT